MNDASPQRSVFSWFGPPKLARPDLARRARALWIVSWPFFAVTTVILGIAVIIEPHTLARRATTIAAVGTLITILHAISRSGRPQLASWVLVIGLSVIVTQRAWITGGIHAPVAVFYVLFIVMAGLLLGARGGSITAALCAGGALLLTVGTMQQWLAPRPGAGDPLGAFVFAMLAIALALVLQSLVARRQNEDLRQDTVQMLVHDMRSPMQVLLARLELLREGSSGENTEDVEAAIGGATVLRRMTNDLLDLSRMEQGRMPVTRAMTDLSTLVMSVVSAVRILQPTREIIIETRGDVSCNCDPELTRRIIENLVSNAMKHTPIEGRIRVAVSASAQHARVAVQDEGPGVPFEKRDSIFEPYSTGAVRSLAGLESSGLGLAFCSLAAEVQGGEIRIEDGNPRGSVFIVELPRQ
jgi:signal transduction histidine kinase